MVKSRSCYGVNSKKSIKYIAQDMAAKILPNKNVQCLIWGVTDLTLSP